MFGNLKRFRFAFTIETKMTKQVLTIALIVLMIIQVALIIYGVHCIVNGKHALGAFLVFLNGGFFGLNAYNLIRLQDL